MTNHRKPLDWTDRPLHRKLLSFLAKPVTVEYLRRYVVFATLGEDLASAIRRFCDEGYAEACPIGIVAAQEASGPELRQLLKQHGLKPRPTKGEMVESLLEVPGAAHELRKRYEGIIYIRMTTKGRDALATWDAQRQTELSQLQAQCHKAFLRGDIQTAGRLVSDFNEMVVGPTEGRIPFHQHRVDELKQILGSTPHILKEVSETDARCLRAAAAMKLLWPLDGAVRWLPEGLAHDISAVDRVANLVMKHGMIRARQIPISEYTGKIGIFFPKRDVSSCDQCRAIEGRAYSIRDFPELPMPTCTSQAGCGCNLHPMVRDGVSMTDVPGPIISLTVGEDETEEDGDGSDPAATRLERLKELRLRDLITEAEYQAARQKIIDEI